MDGDVTVELFQAKAQLLIQNHIANREKVRHSIEIDTTYITFHVFLSSHHRILSDLEPHLRRGVVDETAKSRSKGPTATLRWRRLIWIPIARCLRLLRNRERW